MLTLAPGFLSPAMAEANNNQATIPNPGEDPYVALLRQWCDGMIRLQIKEIKSPGIFGGIMCPAGSRIRGRSADAVYPFMSMAKLTKQEKYLEAATHLQAWSAHASRYDGSWVNEVIGSPWKGITVFGTIALGEALHHHGDLLDAKLREQWMERLRKAAAFVYDFMSYQTPAPINYPVSTSAALAVSGKVLGEARYTQKARELAHKSLDYFTEPNKLIFGEGPRERSNPGIDLGYNIEETLPNLVLYTKITGDTTIVPAIVASLEKHMEFMLPDGAWDNSWGTRNFKWSYWGSRTADGCQPAYALLADHNPVFAEVAHRNLALLQRCTHEGVLYGGLHYKVHGELPDIHHTFCHAKALASCVDYGIKAPANSAALPREKFSGIKLFPEIATWLIGKGSWKATVTNYKVFYNEESKHVSGGALSMLWHSSLGPVLTASMAKYYLQESDNMQPVKDEHYMELTPRLEAKINDLVYTNVYDVNAQISSGEEKAGLKIVSKGILCNDKHESPKDKIPFEIAYLFNEKFTEITITTLQNAINDLNFILPVISDHTEKVEELTDNGVAFYKAGGKLTVKSSHRPVLWQGQKRVFNHVPGFEALPLIYKASGKEGTITIRLTS